METLKFLMVTTHFPPHHLGGDAVFVEYLSNELSLAGHEVHVLTFPGAYSALRGGEVPTSPKGTGTDRIVEHEFRPRFPTAAALASLMAGRAAGAKEELNSLVARTRPDVVHWHNTKGFIPKPFIAGVGRNAYTAHDYYTICPRSNLLRPDLTVCGGPFNCISCHLRWRKPPPLSRGGARRVISFDGRMTVISPSNFMAGTLEKHGIRVHQVIRNFVPRPSQSHVHDDRNNTILYAGMLEPHKGVITLLKGFSESRDRHEFRLTIVGTGSSSETMSKLVGELGLRDRVDLKGFVPRETLDKLRGESAYQIIPSEWPENAPLTAIEALASGTPIITSDQGGLPEMSDANDDALVFKARDSTSLSDCLARAWTETDNLGARRRAAVKMYEERHLPDIHVRRYLDAVKR